MLLLLLSFWIIAGITAEDPLMWHYRVKNSSLCLQAGKSPAHDDLMWTFNKNGIVVSKKIMDKYIDKVDYNQSHPSLCINKLTETDSGIYEITTMDPQSFNILTETHRLIVEETVPRPVIRMSVLTSNRSAGFCNITVNCSVQHDWVWSVCDGGSCQTSQSSFRKVNITVSAENTSVVCRGSNHVSTSNVSESMEATCINTSIPEPEETSQPSTLIIIVIIIAMGVILCAFIFCVAKGLSPRNNHHQAQRSIAQLPQSQEVEVQPRRTPRVSTSSSCHSEASYENVDATQLTQSRSPAISPREELGSMQSPNIDTVYRVLELRNMAVCLGKRDGNKDRTGHKETQEASTSQSVTVDEAEHPTQIDTVYSVLQKPTNLKAQHHQ